MSLRTAHLLQLAQNKGYALPRGIDLKALKEYLLAGQPEQNSYLRAYALYVLALMGLPVHRQADLLLAGEEEPGLHGGCFLGLAFAALGDRAAAEGILARLKNLLRVGTRSVTLVEAPESWPIYGGGLQAKALLMMLYRRFEPRSPLVQALADDLLSSLRRGSWGNTSNTGWALQAFAELFESEQPMEADFSAEVKLGGSSLASQRFKGLSRRPWQQQVSPAELLALAAREPAAKGGVLPLSFEKTGSGTLYYAATLRYALDPLQAAARDEGIGLALELLDREGRPAEALKLGKLYQLRAVIYSSRDRDYLAVRVPLPSGAEAIDSSLATSQRIKASDEGGEDGSLGFGAPVVKIYDNEVRLFYDFFPRGKREVSFWLRATTPGSYPTPPATAELMYEQEVFGRTDGVLYRIVP